MAHRNIDRCKEDTSTTGTGTLTLTGAVAGFVAVADATAGLTGNGDTGWFCAENGAEWEVFLGTRVDATHLARTAVLASSNSGSAVSFTAAPVVFSTVPGARVATVGPAFSAYRASSNQSLTNSVAAKVALNAEDFDTGSCFDSTTNYRFTPDVAGYYSFQGAVSVSGTTITVGFASLYKNGAEKRRGSQINFTSGNSNALSLPVEGTIYLGTTDYVELWAYVGATSPSVTLGEALTHFSGHFVRG